MPEVAARVGLLQLLSRIFIREVDEGLLAVLRREEVRSVIAETVPALDEALERQWGSAEYEEAAIEFCRLFVQPGRCPLVASAWLGCSGPGRKPAPDSGIASLTAGLVAELHLELPVELASLPPDHLCLLLQLHAWLLEAAGPDSAGEFARAALHPWLPSFLGHLLGETSHPLYRAAALFLEDATHA